MIWAFQLTPATPMSLSPTAAIVPEVCVPWPASSIGFPGSSYSSIELIP